MEILTKLEAKKLKDSPRTCMDLSLYGSLAWDEFEISDIHLILQDNRKEFRKIFGSPHFCNNTEFYYHNWILKFNGEYVLVCTAKTKGTGFEILNRSYNNPASVEFVKDFYKQFLIMIKESK